VTQLAKRFAKREEAKEGEEEAKETGECPVQRMQAGLMGIRAGTAEDIDKLARRQVRVTKEHNEECKKLLALMGIPCVTVSDSASCQERQLISIEGTWRGRSAMRGTGTSRQGVCSRIRGYGHPYIQLPHPPSTPYLFRGETHAYLGDPAERCAGGAGYGYGSG